MFNASFFYFVKHNPPMQHASLYKLISRFCARALSRFRFSPVD